MCELLNKKLIQAQDMADHTGQAQAVCRNAIGAYSIVPSDRPGSEDVVCIVCSSDSGDALSWLDWQTNHLFNLNKSGFKPEDIISAAFSLGSRAAEKRITRKIARAIAAIEEHY